MEKKITNAAGRVFAQFTEEMDEQFAQNTDLNGFSSLPRPHVIRRMPDGNKRKYFTMVGDKPMLMSGLTSVVSIIKKQQGGMDFLADWRAEKGAEEAAQILQETSTLGTFMHILCAEIAHVYQAKNDKYFISFNEEFKELFRDAMLSNGVRHNLLSDYYKRCIKGAQSFFHWLEEWNVEIMAIEYCVIDYDNNISTPLDIIAYATEPLTAAAVKRGEKSQRFLGNFNIKFREKADNVFDSDIIQTCLEMEMFNNYLPNADPITRTFTITPKSQVLAKVGCAVHEHTGKYSMEDFALDIAYAKKKKNHHQLFFPDLDRSVTNMGGITIKASGIEYQKPQTIEAFIRSFFQD